MHTGYLSKKIDSLVNTGEDEKRTYIGASSIGNPCGRFLYNSLHGVECAPPPVKVKRTLDIGKMLEQLILTSLQESGVSLLLPDISNHFLAVVDYGLPYFKGHMDAVLLDGDNNKVCVIEIKTAKHSSFNIFKNKGVRLWSPTYYAQVQSYMGMSGIKGCSVLVLNKDTSEIHDEFIEFDADFYQELRSKAKMIKEAVIEPPKINGSSLYYLCRMCKFNRVCHE